MTHDFDLREHQTISNAGTRDNDSVQADLGIRIISLGDQGPFDFTLFGPLINDPDLNLHGVSEPSANEMFALAEECRKTWKSAVVDR